MLFCCQTICFSFISLLAKEFFTVNPSNAYGHFIIRDLENSNCHSFWSDDNGSKTGNNNGSFLAQIWGNSSFILNLSSEREAVADWPSITPPCICVGAPQKILPSLGLTLWIFIIEIILCAYRWKNNFFRSGFWSLEMPFVNFFLFIQFSGGIFWLHVIPCIKFS